MRTVSLHDLDKIRDTPLRTPSHYDTIELRLTNENGDRAPCISPELKAMDSREGNKDMPVKLNELVDIDELKESIRIKDVTCRELESDPNYKILCYSKPAQILNHWNPVTLTMRGVIVDTTDTAGELQDESRVVARSFKKFFAINAVSNGKLTKIDDDEGVVVDENVSFDADTRVAVFDKVDGTMGVCYIGPDGLAHLSTKGAFGSDWSRHSQMILKRKHQLEEFSDYVKRNITAKGENLIFEIISPAFEHVIDYGRLDDVILLGKIRIRDGYWTPIDKNGEIAKRFGFKTTERYSETTLGEAVMQPEIPNHEGVVVTVYNDDGSQDMYKIKYSSYLKLRWDLNEDRNKPSIMRATAHAIYHKLHSSSDRQKYAKFVMDDVDSSLENGVYTENDVLEAFGLKSDSDKVNSQRFPRVRALLNKAYKDISDGIKEWNVLYDPSMTRGELFKKYHDHYLALAYGSSVLDGLTEDYGYSRAFRVWANNEYDDLTRKMHEARVLSGDEPADPDLADEDTGMMDNE